jgi:glyoxylase-like metal-dependent hydrolase (beta-lactamase superfamily II)
MPSAGGKSAGLRLNYGGVVLSLRDYAGAVAEYRGESLCIDVLRPDCRHVFYTHGHERHYGGYAGKFYAPFRGNVIAGTAVRAGPFRVLVIDAYNITKVAGGRPVHSRGEGVGYVIEVAGVVMYHAGDTDLTPQMLEVGRHDIALLPIGGDGVMTPEEAAEAVKLLRPKIAIPVHFTEARHYVKFRDMAQPYAQIMNLKS